MRKLAFFLLLSLACTRETPQPPPAPVKPPPADAGPQAGGRLVRRLEADVNTLNYLLQNSEDERQVLQYLYDPLIDFDANLEPIPGTAARWEIADQGKTYILHIDPRAVFSDGQPVSADDVLFTLQTAVEKSPQFGAWFEGFDPVKSKAIDEKTARIVFQQARVPQLYAFNIGVLPRHVYGKGTFEKIRAVVGNGPYVIDRRQTGKSVLMKRNPHYWREKPLFDTVLFRVISDNNLAWKALERGDIHVTRVDNDLWWRVKDDPQVRRKIAFHDSYQLTYNCVAWNLDDPLFQDVRVRRALAMAFDRQSVIDRLYHGQARAVSGPFTPDTWAYSPEVHPIEFNLQGAAALLASAGWTDSDKDGVLERAGKRFSFPVLIPAGNTPSVDQSQIYQEALRKIGVEMSISGIDATAMFDRLVKGNFQAAMLSWTNDPDPDPYTLFHSSQIPPDGMNIVHYRSAEADQLLDRGRTTFDRARRTEVYHQLHDLIASDQPYLFIAQVGMKWAVDKRMQNVKAAKGVGLFLWHPGPYDWWLKE